MNPRLLVLLLVAGCAPALASPIVELAPPGGEAPREAPAALTPAQLDTLLAPIALYPDPLIAIILPAASFPADVVLAARHVAAGGKPESFESQPWDDSVKALARYPELLRWLDQNLDWTRRVGAAFLQQPAGVLTATQRLRGAARAAGNLQDTPEQTIVVEREIIRVLPARHDLLFVPIYDARSVYRARSLDFYPTGPLIRFSSGYRTGAWLSYHCDWGYNTVVVISRPHRVAVWQSHPRWVCPSPSAIYVHQARHHPRAETYHLEAEKKKIARIHQAPAEPIEPPRRISREVYPGEKREAPPNLITRHHRSAPPQAPVAEAPGYGARPGTPPPSSGIGARRRDPSPPPANLAQPFRQQRPSAAPETTPPTTLSRRASAASTAESARMPARMPEQTTPASTLAPTSGVEAENSGPRRRR